MPVQSFAGVWVGDTLHETRWNTLANGDTGAPQSNGTLPIKWFKARGTFGVGGSVQLEGSDDAVNWNVLKDPQGATIVLTAAGSRSVNENPKFTRPNVTAGDGTTAIVAYMTETVL